jgi:phosphoglycolate phosphatase-like HAD superfamily hydrolase
MSTVCVLIMKNRDIIVLLDIDNTLFNTVKLKESNLTHFELYDEVKDALKELATSATLGILSQGEIAFQNKKLETTQIKQYFLSDHTHIVENKLDVMQEILGKYKGKAKVFFIDDWVDMLRAAKKIDPNVFTIWMKRGEYANVQKKHSDFTPDAVVEDLHDVISLIKK